MELNSYQLETAISIRQIDYSVKLHVIMIHENSFRVKNSQLPNFKF